MSTFDYGDYADTRFIITRSYACPKCGGTQISYDEDVIAFREVLGIASDGTIVVDADNPHQSEAAGTNTRFCCGDCGHTWTDGIERSELAYFDEYTYGDSEPYDFMTDAEADADVLRSAGMGTDEDYGQFAE